MAILLTSIPLFLDDYQLKENFKWAFNYIHANWGGLSWGASIIESKLKIF